MTQQRPPVIVRIARSLARSLGNALARWGSDDGGYSGKAPDAPRDPSPDEPPQDNPEQEQPPDDDASQQPAASERQGRSVAEIVTTAASLTLIALLAGFILYDGYWRGTSDPATVEVRVQVEDARERDGVYYIPFVVHNRGDQTIQETLIVFEARDGDVLVEETDTVIPLLGEHGDIAGVLALDQDPAGLEIDARVSTFQVAEE